MGNDSLSFSRSSSHQYIQEGHTFCCPNIRLNYPAITDGDERSMNYYFYHFIDYTTALRSPLNYFEVISLQFTPARGKLGQVYIRQDTRTRYFVPKIEGFIVEVPLENLAMRCYITAGFLVEKMWQCESAADHSTQLFVRFHHIHHLSNFLDPGARMLPCLVCQAQVEHARVEQKFFIDNQLADSSKSLLSLRDGFSWDEVILRNLGLTGNESIFEL